MRKHQYRWAWIGLGAAAGALVACTGTKPPNENYYRPPEVVEPPDGSPSDASTGGGALIPNLDAAFAECGNPPASTADFTRRRLRREALACTSYQLCGFQAAARALATATQSYADDPSDDTRTTAQEAFRAAMAVWSRIEVMQYGPLGNMATLAGEDMYLGEGLREQVYAWPTVASCRVDEQVLDQGYLEDGVEDLPVTGKGLFALEYLLFAPEDGPSACAAGGTSAEAYEALDADERAARRRAYARAVAEEQARLADALVADYDPDGTFAKAFVSASGYPSGQEALNVLGWALIYIDKELKDYKLGVPAGLIMNAPVTEPESPWSGISSHLLEQNLIGFASLFQGCGSDGSGIGFDDWLVEAGRAELAEELLDAYAEALAGVRALPDDLGSASQTQLEQAFGAVRPLATLMKSDLFGAQSPLNLTLPASIESDVD